MRHFLNEPFRLFFPAAVIAGLIGAALWPLHFSQCIAFYPGLSHARLMAHGFFGGFIFGFLLTAFPRMIGASRFTPPEVVGLLLVFAGMAGAHATGNTPVGDGLFLALGSLFLVTALARLRKRKDLPPPGFVLVPLAFISALGGAVISLLEQRDELPPFWVQLKPLLYYQGFVLLPILGVGGFILPKFFGLPNRHDYPASRNPPPGWTGRMLGALSVGVIVLASFFIEAAGWPRPGHLARLLACVAWLLHEVPVHRVSTRGNDIARGLKAAFALLFLGILILSFSPGHRVAWLHLTLIGGFGLITLAVATRVVFGHTGNGDRLRGRNRWFLACCGVMLMAMATRVSGDLWPKILVSHYNYGAVFWSIGLLWWAGVVLPRVRIRDPDE